MNESSFGDPLCWRRNRDMAGGALFKGVLYCLCLLLCAVVLGKVRSRKVRHLTLLAASYAAYLSWSTWFAAVLIVSTGMNFLLGKWIRQKPFAFPISVGILLNIALLSTFKYLPEAAVSLPFSSLQRFAHLALPLGISFWTFQAMSYLFDQYGGEELDPSLTEFALYMAFFPVTISGPVCRMPEMLPQFRSEEPLSADDFGAGFRRIAAGVLMMQLARILGQGILSGDGINSGFDHAVRWGGTDVWCLAFGYGLQLFFDFAGYSHIAIGAARILGITLPENFERPFQSTSPSVFWTRWHMSLSFWIRDYVFLPLATLRRDLWWRYLALAASMVVFGLWHRASLLFVLWGLFHGVLLVLHRLWQQLQRKFRWDASAPILTPLGWLATAVPVSAAWILFRANSSAEAGQMIKAALSPASYSYRQLSPSLYWLVALLVAGYAVTVLVADLLQQHAERMESAPAESAGGFLTMLVRNRWYWLPPLYVLALISVLMVSLTGEVATSGLMYRSF